MADFLTIPDIIVVWEPHWSGDVNVHIQFNALYGGSMPNFRRIFVNETTCDEVKADNDLRTTIVDIITDEMIIPVATQTTNVAAIRPLILAAPKSIHVNVRNRGHKRLSKDFVTEQLEYARDTPNCLDKVEIHVSTTHLYFSHTVPITYLNWDHILGAPPAVAVPPAAPPSAADIARAVAGAIPAAPIFPSAADIGNAIGNALAAQGGGRGGGAGGAGAIGAVPPRRPTTASAAYTFNTRGLPADVLTAFTNKMDGGLVTGTSTRTPYAGGNLYHIDGDRYILADGSLFLAQEPNEKGLMKNPPTCEKDHHAGVRQWYQSFTIHCMDHGFYVHPLWCFRANHGGSRGFTTGADAMDDLPAAMAVPLESMSRPLFSILQRKDMFPPGSNLAGIVQSCYGNGYQSLLQVIFNSHPAFHPQPSTLITSYPKQRGLSLNEYFMLFKDFLQLRAYISNITQDLSHSNELDVFISNADHAWFLNRVSREDRRYTANAYKYVGNQLVSTLHQFLLSPDSPLMSTQVRAPPSSNTVRRSNSAPVPAPAPRRFNNPGRNNFSSPGRGFRPAPRATPVNHLASTNDGDTADRTGDSPTPDLEAVSSDELCDLADEVYNVELPEDPTADDREIYHLYAAKVHRISADTNLAATQPCIVCGGTHRFDKCNVLKNTDFLRNHYIRFCQQLRREGSERSRVFHGTEANIPMQNVPVNFIDVAEEDDSDYDPETDFQMGRA